MSEPQTPPDGAPDLQRSGATLLTALHALTRALTLYDANNAAVERIIGELEACLLGWFGAGGESLRLQAVDDEVFVNGRLLKVDATIYDRVTELSERLGAFGVGDLRFGPELDRAGLEAFVAALADCLRANSGDLSGQGWPGIDLAASEGRSIASFRFQPDRLAVWLYGSLLEVVVSIYEQHRAGEAPSLLPLKRTLQLVIDNMRDHGAIYQLLSAVHDPRQPPSVAHVRARISVDLIGFGLWVGLSAEEVMTLALGGALGGLTDAQTPDAAVTVLVRYRGLGAAAVPLTLLLHDARATRGGKRSGVPGRILGMVEEYWHHITAAEGRGARAPARILAGMREGQVRWIAPELARLFAAWKGPYPLGTLVVLSDDQPAVVTAQGPGPQGKARPTVARLSPDGELVDRIDLAQHPELSIVAAPDPGATPIRVALLDRRADDPTEAETSASP